MSEKIDTSNHPTVKALIEHRERLGISDALLATRYIGVSKTTWSQLQSGTYPAQDPAPMLDKCADALRKLEDQAERADSGGKLSIVALPHVEATLKALKRCYGAPQNRLVVYLAETGGGKTTTVRRVHDIYRSAAIGVEASESWRKSYRAAGLSIARAAGLTSNYPLTEGAATLEADLRQVFSVEGCILTIDEAHYCGPEALNLIKFILNRTAARVVLVSIPSLWSRMEQTAYKEVEQLRRRTAAKIVVSEVSREDCRKFLKSMMPGYAGLNGDEKKAVEVCCGAANKFGLYDTLERICSELREELADKMPATLDAVTAAIKRVEALRS